MAEKDIQTSIKSYQKRLDERKKDAIEAINGKLIYSDITDDYVAGRRQQMIGLDQAVLQLSVGSRAKVILPSNLAYGIGGDGDRIPQSAILVIDVKVN